MADVVFDHVNIRYPGADAPTVKDLNLEIADGEFLVLVGPSGCGKSTTLRALAGLEPTDSGIISIGGRDVTGEEPGDRDIAMVFQDYALYPHMSVRENMGFALTIKKRPKSEIAERVERAAEILDLTEFLDRKPKDLSGGQRQRVAIARALAPEPTVLIADEPVSMLDVSIRLGVLNLLARLQREENLAMLYITHDLATARHFSDEILVMYRGEVVERGPADQVILDPQAEFTKQLLVAAPEPGNNPRFLAEARRRGVPMPDHLAPAEETS